MKINNFSLKRLTQLCLLFTLLWGGVSVTFALVQDDRIPPEFTVNVDPGAEPPLKMFVRGGFNGWGIASPLTFTDGISSAVLDLDVGQVQFKVADENWSTGTNCGAGALEDKFVSPGNKVLGIECNNGNTPNMILDITEPGEHKVFFSYSDTGASQIQVIPLLEDVEPDLPTIGTVTVHYKRASEDYDPWGIHLEGEAIPASWGTTIRLPHKFDKVENGWAIKEVPIVADDVEFTFTILAGSNLSPGSQLNFVPSVFGTEVWVVQDDLALYTNESDTAASLAMVGNRSANVDLSAVVVKDSSSNLGKNWSQSASFMEIFVRSYQDSDGDGIGDIQGLISRLDYLQKMGITGLWLMPVTKSGDRDHGYAVEDFRTIEPDYGTMADFEELLKEAHSRGIGIVIDYVINHASNTNPLFLDASFSTNHDLHDWFVFSETDPKWGESFFDLFWQPSDAGFYYAVFGGQMPDFNMKNPEVVEYHMDSMRFWLNKGVDGFRFDAVSGLIENGKDAWLDQPENHLIMKRAQDLVNSYTGRYVVCETPISQEAFAAKDSCGRAFAFEVGRAYLGSATTGAMAEELVRHLQNPIRDQLAVFLSNHDTFSGDRLFNRLAGDEEAYKLVSSMYLLTTSTPFTYYGEEIGVANAQDLFGDPAIRQPMSWNDDPVTAGFTTGTPYRNLSSNVSTHNVAFQQQQADSLLEHYQSIYSLRKKYPEFGIGELELQSAAGDSHLIFARNDSKTDKTVAVMTNLSHEVQVLTVKVPQANKAFAIVSPSRSVGKPMADDQVKSKEMNNNSLHSMVKSDANGNIKLEVAARSTLVLTSYKRAIGVDSEQN